MEKWVWLEAGGKGLGRVRLGDMDRRFSLHRRYPVSAQATILIIILVRMLISMLAVKMMTIMWINNGAFT